MTERLKIICSEVPYCQTFADVGCDHGYVAEEILRSGKCKRAIISDVSAKSLKKAEILLESEIACGRVLSFVSDGFKAFPKTPKADVALIAGMGGEEICLIISAAKEQDKLPDKLLLQPMRNCDKVRKTLVSSGYRIIKDYVFKEGDRFYDLILSEKGKDVLTEGEILFGRTNLKENPPAFTERIQKEKAVIDGVLAGKDVSDEEAKLLKEKREIIGRYVKIK